MAPGTPGRCTAAEAEPTGQSLAAGPEVGRLWVELLKSTTINTAQVL